MNKSFFFPNLQRREKKYYLNRNKKFYADYTQNYALVAEDCLHRCVYCDATEKECGGDRFELDHFRPQKVFAEDFEHLVRDPHNLYLSCRKCNGLKSDDWQGCVKTDNGHTYVNKIGYVDRFKDDWWSYMKVERNGRVESNEPNGPAEYMIKRLMLNRPNRVFLRKKRLFLLEAKAFINELNQIVDKILKDAASQTIEPQEALDKIKRVEEIRKQYQSVIS